MGSAEIFVTKPKKPEESTTSKLAGLTPVAIARQETTSTQTKVAEYTANLLGDLVLKANLPKNSELRQLAALG